MQNHTVKIIEVELKNTDFDTLHTVEQHLESIPEFDGSKTIEVSKFQIIKNILADTDQDKKSP
jgi:hypothetical protein